MEKKISMPVQESASMEYGFSSSYPLPQKKKCLMSFLPFHADLSKHSL